MRLRRRFSLAAACLSVLLPVSTWSAIPSAIALPGAAPAEVPAEASMDPQPLPREGAGSAKPWWQRAVFYEIYPRSFADSNGDGIGDINGITSKLDYLKDLGVDALWITPCYPSPQVDFGYDISDYCNIAPEFGTLADFDNLVKEAKKRDIRIIMDLVMNHTSDKHPWFVASKSSAKDSKRDFYVWRDGKNGGPPNNWQSVFGHSAWQLDKTTGQYYYHFFYPEQPDLNWRNPAVKEAMYDVTRFWLDKGVAGFRLDAISTLYEDEKLTDNPTKPGVNNFGDPNMDHKYNDRLPQIHDVLRELRTVMGKYDGDRVVIGETFTADISGLWDMYGKKLDEIQLPMNFFFADVNKLDAQQFQKIIKEVDANPVQGWPVYLFSNHDQQRAYIRYGDGKHNDQIAKMMATMLLTLRGTPILYYGEEIGMTNRDPVSKDEVQDPIGKIGWPKEKGRDGERTPMQWSAQANAGFSTAKKTWVPVADNYKTHNVASETADEQSIFRFYQNLIQLRRKAPALRDGRYEAVEGNPKVLSYVRQSPDQVILVAVNMSPEDQVLEIKPQHRHGRGHSAVLQASWPNATTPAGAEKVSLPPYGSLVLEYKP